MSLMAIPYTFSPNTLIRSADVTSNFSEIQNKFNASAVLTDTPTTITVTHLWTASQTFSNGINVAAAAVFSGTLSAAGRITASAGLTVTTAGLTVTAGATAVQALTAAGLVTASAGLTVTGNATVNSGILFVNTAVSTNAGVGDVILPNNKSLRGVNAAGNDTFALIRLSTTNTVLLDPNGIGARVAGILTTNGITDGSLGSGQFAVGAADSGGAGFRMLRVPN